MLHSQILLYIANRSTHCFYCTFQLRLGDTKVPAPPQYLPRVIDVNTPFFRLRRLYGFVGHGVDNYANHLLKDIRATYTLKPFLNGQMAQNIGT